MATTTSRQGLRKPATTDLVNVATDINDNMDKLDSPDYVGAAGDEIFTSKVTADAGKRLRVLTDGTFQVGDGAVDPPLDRLLRTRVVRKTVDELVNNTTTLQNDDVLLFPVAANEIWEFELYLRGTLANALSNGFKFAFTAPAGVTLISWVAQANPVAASQSNTASVSQEGSGVSGGLGFNLIAQTILIKGIIINGVNAGNVTLQWAQAVAHASDNKILANSILIARKLA